MPYSSIYSFEPNIPIESGNVIHNQNMYLKFDAFSFRGYKKHQAKCCLTKHYNINRDILLFLLNQCIKNKEQHILSHNKKASIMDT